MKKWVLILIILLAINTVSAVNEVNVYFFYGQGCPHCAHEEVFLDELEVKYPTINIERYEVYQNDENRELFHECSALAGASIQGVPTTFIDAKPHIGFSNSIGEDIESEIERCLIENCTDILTLEEDSQVCDTNLQDYQKEETVGQIMLWVLGLIIILIVLNQVIFKKNKKKIKKVKVKRKGLSSKKKTKK